MLRTVLGWRCRWGPGRSLPTSYTSPRATNKPLIVFPIHTDRGHHCLSGFTPCLSHGPWFTPFENYLYSSVSFTQSLWFPEHNAAEQRGSESHKDFLLNLCLPIILLFKKKIYLLYSIPLMGKDVFPIASLQILLLIILSTELFKHDATSILFGPMLKKC